MTIQTALLTLNAVVCGLSALRLLTYRRGHQQHHYFAGLLAYMLIVAFGAITILIIAGVYGPVQPYETIRTSRRRWQSMASLTGPISRCLLPSAGMNLAGSRSW